MIILFDLDGTLIDSTQAILEGFHHTFDVYKLPHPKDDEIKALIGHPLEYMYTALRVEEGLIFDIVKSYKKYYQGVYKEKTLLLEGAIEAISEASKIARLGIVTTKTGSFSKDLLIHFKVMDFFEVLIGREHVVQPKPHAEPILKALEQMNAGSEEVWMIGDTRLDIASAQNAGVKSVAVTSGYDTKEQLLCLSDCIEENALDAVRYISALKK